MKLLFPGRPWNEKKAGKTAAGIVEMEFCYVRAVGKKKMLTAEKQSPCFPAYQSGVQIIPWKQEVMEQVLIVGSCGKTQPAAKQISSCSLYSNLSLGVEIILENRSC